MALDGSLNEFTVKILKKYGVNTKGVSAEFLEKQNYKLVTRNSTVTILHSKKGTTEISSLVLIDATIHISSNKYISNWAVVDARYDVLLGVPCNLSVNPKITYVTRTVTIGKDKIKLSNGNINDQKIVKVLNIRLKFPFHGHKKGN